MGQSPGFQCDIFISYSHKDNRPLPGKGRGWVDEFHEALENWLRHRRGFADLQIWRDRELDGNALFDLSIENRLKSSALFFALVSPNYLRSDYCRKELRCFHRFASGFPGGLRLGEESRIFTLLLRNVPHAEWPEELAGASGFPLHDSQTAGSLGDFTSPNDGLFEKQLRGIVDAVEKMFDSFPRTAAAAGTDISGGGEARPVRIYLADVADSLIVQRKRLAADLGLKNATILPTIPPPSEAAEHAHRVNEVLGQAQLSVHLLGQGAGRPLDDREDTTYPQEQLRIALAGPVSQVIWLPEGLRTAAIEDERYRRLLERLESGPRDVKGFDLLRGTPAALTEFLRQKIQRLAVADESQTAETVLIDTHQKDQSYAYRLADALSRNGLDVEFNKESHDPTQSLSNFEVALRHVRNLVITFGRVAPDWLEGRIKKAVKIAAEQFDTDMPVLLENIWVLLLPPSGGRHPLQKLPRLIHVDVLDNSHAEDIDPAVVNRLLGARTPERPE